MALAPHVDQVDVGTRAVAREVERDAALAHPEAVEVELWQTTPGVRPAPTPPPPPPQPEVKPEPKPEPKVEAAPAAEAPAAEAPKAE